MSDTQTNARSTIARLVPSTVTGVILAAATSVLSLDNGVARTPPMGWNTFNCWNGQWDDQMLKDAANSMVLSGLKDCGYIYCNADGSNGGETPYWPSRTGFVNWAKPVADYVHTQGLKFGVFTSVLENPSQAASDLAAAGVDFCKFDAWTTPSTSPQWKTMGDALVATGKQICYSSHSSQPGVSNLWRTSGDINGSWGSWTDCLNTAATGGGKPGGWPDPDMLEVHWIADPNEAIAHFSLWCVISAPLILGNDVRSMYLFTKYVVANTEAIAVNQDTAVNDQKRILTRVDGTEVWRKTLAGGAKAVVLFNKTTAAKTLSVTWSEIGLPAGVAQVRDLWEHKSLGPFTDSYSASIPAHGCSFVKIVSGSTPLPEPPPTWAPKPSGLSIMPLDRTGWTATSDPSFTYDSARANPIRLLDNDVATLYAIVPASEAGHWVAVDMKSPRTFNAVICDGDKSGPNVQPYESYKMAHRWKVYVSTNGTTWGNSIGEGMWGPRATTAIMRFPSQTARYVKIVYDRSTMTDSDMGGWTMGVDELYVGTVTDSSTPASGRMPASRAGSARTKAAMLSVALSDAPHLPQGARGFSLFTIQGRKLGGSGQSGDERALPRPGRSHSLEIVTYQPLE